jgi:RIO kinase 1
MQDILDFRDEKPDRKVLHHSIEVGNIGSGVFDDRTLMTLYSLVKKRKLDRLCSMVSRGKEASIFHGRLGRKDVAVKIYMIETSNFRDMVRYIDGDPRFSVGKKRHELVFEWASKEYKNLRRVEGKVTSPKPIAVERNVLVMEFVGKDGVPAPKLKDSKIENPKEYLTEILKNMRAMYKLGLVHGDVSEYNILDWKKPVLIDFSMGVVLEHPLAQELIVRDVTNTLKYFEKLGVKKDYNKTLAYVKGGK